MLTLIQEKSYVRVLQLIQGGADPNKSYLGVSPLSLSVEIGDADMVAILLDWKADPLHKHGTQAPSALQMAEKMSKDPKCAHQAAAKEMVAMIGDPQLVKARLQALEGVIAAQRESDRRKAILFAAVCALISVGTGLFYRFVASRVPDQAGEL